MRLKEVPFTWIQRWGMRLDTAPYMGDAVEARFVLESLKSKTQPLRELTAGGIAGIVHAGRIKRQWVEDPRYGTPFLSSTDILRADLTQCSLISNRAVRSNPLLIIHKGWTLITRAGTVGRMAYSRPDMDGMACTEDVLRVIPDKARILPGYLFAFLSSRFGVPLVTSGTYGAIIQHIEPEHISDTPIPRLGDELESESHRLIEEAASARCLASTRLEQAQRLLLRALKLDVFLEELRQSEEDVGQVVLASEIAETMRLEGYYYNPRARRIAERIRARPEHRPLGNIADVYDVPPFKHIYVESGNGVPFFTSGELFNLDRRASKFLSRTRTKNLHLYILERGWVLLARSGQLGGILGKPQYADSALNGAATSDHVIRIVPKEKAIPAGYIYAYLSSREIGYPLLTRTMTGHSIPALWPSQLASVPFLPLSDGEMKKIHSLVEEAFELRVTATACEDDARALIERALSEGV
ncbi:MAG: restriction endonuclease subunit S [Dehalococcoidia bacterium]|nr:MAG: restriction endonuclease subunit S [Dehalococcoidia bacterium]